MARRKEARVVRALPPSMSSQSGASAPAKVPHTEVIEIHTTRKSSRNASGAILDGKTSTMVPVLGGIAGGTAAVIASQRWNAHPGLVAAGTAAAGLAAMTMGKQQWVRQAGAGAVVGAAVIGAVPMVVSAFAKAPTVGGSASASQPTNGPRRGAEGDGYVTRQELDDALGKLADSQKDAQKQQTYDLLGALREDFKKLLASGAVTSDKPVPPLPAVQAAPPSFTYPIAPRAPVEAPVPRPAVDTRGAYGDERDADGVDDYTRNAYGEEMRDAETDEYTRNAYGDEMRDAEADEYARNAYADDMRDAGYYDERDADAEERDSDGDERDSDGD
jgi:hypothetical protein